jgi:ABC-type sugar transport system permease subunit
LFGGEKFPAWLLLCHNKKAFFAIIYVINRLLKQVIGTVFFLSFSGSTTKAFAAILAPTNRHNTPSAMILLMLIYRHREQSDFSCAENNYGNKTCTPRHR